MVAKMFKFVVLWSFGKNLGKLKISLGCVKCYYLVSTISLKDEIIETHRNKTDPAKQGFF
jgi:hypothetical protein